MNTSASTSAIDPLRRPLPTTTFVSCAPAPPLLRVRFHARHLTASLRTFEFCKAFDSHGPGNPAEAMSLLRFAVQRELEQRGYEFQPAGADLRIDCVVFARHIVEWQDPAIHVLAADPGRHTGRQTLGTTSVSIVALPTGRPVLEAFAQARIPDFALARPERTIKRLAGHFLASFPPHSDLFR
ncbi:MAG: hypothetical protein WDO56_29360 [Gammaproteobacteria bacterium]